MLLAEEPATLIHHTINNFNIHADKAAVARIKESLSTLQQARDLRLGECEAALKKLSRSLHTVQSEYEDLAAAHSAAAHAGEIARLDTQKFRTAKAASDAETEAERTAQQAADLSARLQQLELQGVDGGGRDGDDESLAATGGGAGTGAAVVRLDPLEDELLLRLKVYRSLGIEVERDERDGEYSRAIVRNDRTGKVQIVNIDKKVSRFFYANLFWQTL